jgi:hypothetical protein
LSCIRSHTGTRSAPLRLSPRSTLKPAWLQTYPPAQIAANGFGDDQRLRGDAHDPQAAMPQAPIKCDGRSALCEPAVSPRRLALDTTRREGKTPARARQCDRAQRAPSRHPSQRQIDPRSPSQKLRGQRRRQGG